MGREYEIKFRGSADSLSAIAGLYGPMAEISMETAYYDTPSGALQSRGWMLRRRLENGKSVCTLKLPLPDGSRGEWETPQADIPQAVAALTELGCPQALAELTKEGLIQRCAARFTRLVKTVRWGGSVIELALDRGALLAGGREEPFAEVEAELKAGDEADCDAFARSLAARFRLEEEPRSKSQRAFALLGEKG